MIPQLNKLRYPIRSTSIISIPSRSMVVSFVWSVVVLVLVLGLFFETGSFAFSGAEAHVGFLIFLVLSCERVGYVCGFFKS